MRSKDGMGLMSFFSPMRPFLATGAWRSRQIGIPGEDLPQVIGALEFLEKTFNGEIKEVKGKVAVIGGGNAAIDSARTLHRLGADEVQIIYRRTKAEMPANKEEIEEAELEGIKFRYLLIPTEIEGTPNGLSLTLERMELGEPDSSGRPRPVPVPGSQFKEEFNFGASRWSRN